MEDGQENQRSLKQIGGWSQTQSSFLVTKLSPLLLRLLLLIHLLVVISVASLKVLLAQIKIALAFRDSILRLDLFFQTPLRAGRQTSKRAETGTKKRKRKRKGKEEKKQRLEATESENADEHHATWRKQDEKIELLLHHRSWNVLFDRK